MRSLKHAILSLKRRPTKAIMIFFIMLIVFELIFTGIIIQNSITESKKYIRIKMGGIIEYTIDYDKYMKDRNDGIEVDEMQLRISENAALEIAKDPEVKEFFVSAYGNMNSKTLKSGNQDVLNQYESDSEEYVDWIPDYNYQISFIKSERPIEMANNRYTLTEGRTFTKEEILGSTKVVILSEEVRKSNELQLGDTVDLVDYQSYYMKQEKEFLETGIYPEYSEPTPEKYEVVGFFSGATDYEVDRLFMPFGILLEGIDVEMVDQYISNICFLVEDPLKVTEFIERNKEKLPNVYLTLTAGDQQYETLTRPLDLMELISKILIWVIFIAGALIIIAIVTIFVRDRKFEVGLLLSSGESKFQVVFQFVIEILVVAVLAFGVATGASQATSGGVANWIVENQLVEDEYPTYYYSMQNEVSMEEIAAEFDVGLGFEVITKLLIISVGLLVLASCIPLIVIVTYKPRKALQD